MIQMSSPVTDAQTITQKQIVLIHFNYTILGPQESAGSIGLSVGSATDDRQQLLRIATSSMKYVHLSHIPVCHQTLMTAALHASIYGISYILTSSSLLRGTLM